MKLYPAILILTLFTTQNLKANWLEANPSNYITFLPALVAGDTLHLAAGAYTHNLTLNSIQGTADQPIVILGDGNTTLFQGQSCCNTVSLTQCAYLVIRNLQLDGQDLDIDAVKAEGTNGNWTHHITLEYLYIIRYGSSQQNVGISTKCASWNWIVRKNSIVGAGTGMYFGNSDGTDPFVNGIIEYNYVANTVGYNIEVKHQLNGTREEFPGTSVDGKTIIRHNVFTKDETSSTGGNARPNLLVGGFPTTGWGATDYYEIYGNFFYNNPVEALFQGTGNIIMYENIFVNHFDPSGLRAVYITPQNGVNPQDIKVFHNTVWALNSSGGIRLYNPNTNFQQYCYANVVFSPSPITNFTNSVDNITDDYANAANYFLSATTDINTLDVYPKSGQLTGSLTAASLFQNNTNWDKDFNGDLYDWTFRGAYSGCCTNPGWRLQLDTMPQTSIPSSVFPVRREADISVFPNPVSSTLLLDLKQFVPADVELYNLSGSKLFSAQISAPNANIDFTDKPAGMYFLIVKNGDSIITKKIVKDKL